MTSICIYAGNRGLGPCAGAVAKIKVASKRTNAWKGLEALAGRLQETKEEPGVCQFHELHGRENGYLLAPAEAPAPRKRATRTVVEHPLQA
jgi:hypothetical protein